MTTKSRTYPDISYVETDTETIVNALIQGYEKIAGRTLYPADPARLFILWVADIIVQERVNIDFSAKQNIPRYAEGEYLDSLAELFKGAERPTQGDLNIAFELLNHRYNNESLYTIISTEKLLDDLIRIDEAIGSRIAERSKGHRIQLKPDPSRNWRTK